MHITLCLYSFSLFLMQSKCHNLILRIEVSNECYTYPKKVTCSCVTSVLCWGWYEGSLFFLLLLPAWTPLLFIVRTLHVSANLKILFPKSWLSCVLIISCCLQSNFTHLHSPLHSDQMVWHSCLCFVHHGLLLHWKPQSRTSCQHQILCKDAE